METEKRLLWFLILALGILLFFNHFFKPTTSAPSLQKVEKPTLSLRAPKPEECQPQSWENKYWSITLCLSRGYISNVQIRRFEESLLYQNILFLESTQKPRIETTSQSITFSSSSFIKKIKFLKPYLWETYVKRLSLSEKSFLEICTFKEDKSFYRRYQEVFYKKEKEEPILRLPYSKIKNPQVITNPQLLGLRDRYYALVILEPPPGEYILEKRSQGVVLSWKPPQDKPFKAKIFIGPQEMKILKLYDLQDVINFGFFHGIGILILKILYFGFRIFKNWGIAIIFLSTLIYIILFPLTVKSTKSMRKMQELQPEIEELRRKFKDNPQKLNKEILELYRKYKINPLGGCLPLFLQIPIFFALYQVLIRAVEIKGAKFLWIKDLSLPDYLIKFPFSLPILGDGLHLLPLIMMGLMFLQQKLTTPKTQASEQQKLMSVVFPLLFGIIFYRFPSGLVLYWVCNSLFTFIYQLRLTKISPS